MMPMQPLDRTIGVLALGDAPGPELAAAIAALAASGATARSAATTSDPTTFDALLLAPGTATLTRNAKALIRAMLAAGKPIAALGEGGLAALVAADGARGLAVAAPPPLHAWLIGAGAQPNAAAACADRGIVTGAGTAFVVALLQEFAAEFASTGPRRPGEAVAQTVPPASVSPATRAPTPPRTAGPSRVGLARRSPEQGRALDHAASALS